MEHPITPFPTPKKASITSTGCPEASASKGVAELIPSREKSATTPLKEIVATGANEVPQYGGGQYWPDPETYEDTPGGRDYTKGEDANRTERARIVEEIVRLFKYNEVSEEKEKEEIRQSLLRSSIKYLTEYSRPVHAEMSAIIACARSGISLNGATL